MKAFVDLFKSQNLHEIAHNYIRSINETYKQITIYDDDHKKQPIKASDYNEINIGTVLKLLDENTKALEDLSYALNKRRIVLLEGNSVFDVITKEYGSVNDLNLKYRSLLAENAQLSKIESRSNKDSFVRRLNLSKATSTTLRNLSIFFNMEYQTQKEVAEVLEKRIIASRHSSERRSNGSQVFLGILYPQELDIEDLLNDKGFCIDPFQDLTQYQGSQPNPPADIKSAISFLDKDIHNLEEELSKIRDSIQMIKDPVFRVSDNLVTNVEKHESVANSLFHQLSSHRDILKSHGDDIDELIKEINEVMMEKRKLERKVADFYEPIQLFASDHIQKLELLSHNKEIDTTLYYACCCLGIELDNGRKDSPVSNHISNQLAEVSLIYKDIPSEQATPNTIFRAIRSQKKLVRPNGATVPLHQHPNPQRNKSRFQEVPKPLEAPQKIALKVPQLDCERRFSNFHRLVTTDRVFRGDQKSELVRNVVNDMMKRSYRETMHQCRKLIESYEIWQQGKLMNLRALNTKLLQCEKISVEVQTEGLKVSENCCQCDPSDFPKPQKRGK